MGADAVFYRQRTKQSPIEEHDFMSCGRYYDVDYERGDWPAYAEELLRLMSENENVWYCSDYVSFEEIRDRPFTIEDFNKLNKHWIENGNRPLHDKWKTS